MTIISSEYELQEKILKAEADIKMGKVYTVSELLRNLENNKKSKKLCMK